MSQTTQHGQLIAILLSLPVTQSYDGRTSLLSGIPHTGLNRSEGNQEVDVSRLVDQLAPLRNSEGISYLVLFIGNAIRVARYTEWEAKLRGLQEALQQTPPSEPVNPSPTAAGEDALHKSLVQVLRRSEQTDQYSGRSELLRGIPENLTSGLTRNEEDRRLDVRAIVYGMAAKGQLDDGRYPLLIVIENALEPEEGAELGRELKTIQKALAELYAYMTQSSDPDPSSQLPDLPAQKPDALTKEERVAFTIVQTKLTRASEEINLLRRLKGLHSCLHKLFFQCYQPLILHVAPVFPANSLSIVQLKIYAQMFHAQVRDVERIATNFAIDSVTTVWVHDVIEIDQDLQRTLESKDRNMLDGSLERLRSLLNLEPVKINNLLIHSASALDLKGLEVNLSTVVERLSPLANNDAMTKTVLRQFHQIVEELGHFHPLFSQVVKDHGQYQDLDSILSMLDVYFPDTPARQLKIEEEISQVVLMLLPIHWPQICNKSQGIRRDVSEDWATSLGTIEQSVNKALQNRHPDETLSHFREFVTVFRLRFYSVDEQLIQMCEKLTTIVNLIESQLRLWAEQI